MQTAPRRCRGFTLLELMVTVVIAAILLTIAVPGFLAFQRSSAVLSAASSFAAALNAARAEAIKAARPALVVPLVGKDWASGWQVFVDMNGTGTFESGDVLVLTQAALTGGVSASTSVVPGFAESSRAYVRYDLYGIPRPLASSAVTFPNGIDFTASAGTQVTTRRVMVGVVGRPRTCDPIKDSTTCTLATP